MKRSEAVDIIRKILSRHEDDQLMPIHYIDSLSCELLCAVEESIGMLPPCRECKENPSEFYCKQEPGEEHQLKWEEEDEVLENEKKRPFKSLVDTLKNIRKEELK